MSENRGHSYAWCGCAQCTAARARTSRSNERTAVVMKSRQQGVTETIKASDEQVLQGARAC